MSPDVAEALTRVQWQTDVRDILPSVHTPTALVIGEADAGAAVEEAEYVASLMPHATVHRLPGRSGLQVEAIMDIARDLAGIERRQASTVLATVLFTDLVDSTRTQAGLGDRRWRELLLAHHEVVRAALSRWGGNEHDTAGDGFFASFAGPARAIDCAHEVTERVSELGIEVRAGVHIGECEVIDGKPGGLAVTIGARLLNRRHPTGRRLADREDLVAERLLVHDRGEHELKGVPGRWRLYLAEPAPGGMTRCVLHRVPSTGTSPTEQLADWLDEVPHDGGRVLGPVSSGGLVMGRRPTSGCSSRRPGLLARLRAAGLDLHAP